MANIKRIGESDAHRLVNKNIRLPLKWMAVLRKHAEDQSMQGKVESVSNLIRVAVYEKWIKQSL
jgi:hypothetical protein